MKDYEKLAVAIGGGALAIAAYQAYKEKQAADAIDATDPSRNPVTAAIDLGTNVIGTTYDWFRQGFNTATGRVSGRSEEVLDKIGAIPSSIMYNVMRPVDFGRDALEAGTKYVWSLSAHIAKSGKEKYNALTNKAFTAMGSAPIHAYEAARKLPQSSAAIANTISGIGSKLEETTKTMKSKAEQIKDGLSGVYRKLGFKPRPRG